MKKQEMYEYEIEYVYLGKQNTGAFNNAEKFYFDIMETSINTARRKFAREIVPTIEKDGFFIWITDTLEIPQS